jgi:hypothetical protein
MCGSRLICSNGVDYERGQQLIRDARSSATIALTLAIASGAAIVADAVVWFTRPGARSRTTATLVPAIDGRSAGLTLIQGSSWHVQDHRIDIPVRVLLVRRRLLLDLGNVVLADAGADGEAADGGVTSEPADAGIDSMPSPRSYSCGYAMPGFHCDMAGVM